MNICTQYNCPHNKSGACQVTMCDRIFTFSSKTNDIKIDTDKSIEKINKEIQRLNNIINELEKWLIEYDVNVYVLDKLKELKEKV